MLVFDELVLEHLLEIGTPSAQMRQPINHIDNQVKPVEVVLHTHVKRRCDSPLFFIAADV